MLTACVFPTSASAATPAFIWSRTCMRVAAPTAHHCQSRPQGDGPRARRSRPPARSVARLAQRSMVLSVEQGEVPSPGAAVRTAVARGPLPGGIDGPGRRAAVRLCCRARGVLDRAAPPVCVVLRPGGGKWRADYRIDGTEGLQLHLVGGRTALPRPDPCGSAAPWHHLYRAMAWLGEPLADQSGAGACLPSSGGFHGHHQPILTGTGRRRARPPRPLERLPA